jgi:hypothetical protein
MCIFAAFVCMHIQSFDQFNEMAVQYGYLALFAPAFPLAPLLAFINNIFEIRIDAIKFCAIHQRPRFRQAEDIGTWYVLPRLSSYPTRAWPSCASSAHTYTQWTSWVAALHCSRSPCLIYHVAFP